MPNLQNDIFVCQDVFSSFAFIASKSTIFDRPFDLPIEMFRNLDTASSHNGRCILSFFFFEFFGFIYDFSRILLCSIGHCLTNLIDFQFLMCRSSPLCKTCVGIFPHTASCSFEGSWRRIWASGSLPILRPFPSRFSRNHTSDV